MRDILEVIGLFLVIIILVRGCGSCTRGYHTSYGIKGWGESIIFGEKYIKRRYGDEEEKKGCENPSEE